MGAGVTLFREDDMDHHPEEIKKLLLDKNEQDKLFTQIAKSVNPNKESFNAATIINVRNLVHYFKNDPNPVLKHIIPHKEVILTAHKHACERVQYLTIKKEKLKGKKSRRKSYCVSEDLMSENISRENFKFLMATLYLYGHLWKVFHIMDEQAICDMRVTKEEFVLSKTKLGVLKFITNVEQISDTHWEEGFDYIDMDHSGAISFEEMCMFSIVKLKIQPTDFLRKGQVIIADDSELGCDEEEIEDLGQNLGARMESVSEAVERMEKQMAEEEEEREKEAQQKKDHAQRHLVVIMNEDGNKMVHSLTDNTLDKTLATVVDTAYLVNVKTPSPTNKDLGLSTKPYTRPIIGHTDVSNLGLTFSRENTDSGNRCSTVC